MYVPKHFEETRIDVLHGFIRAHPFAALVTRTGSGIEANHVPLLLAPEPAPLGTLRGHVARANPLWREHEPGAEVLMLFQGPHAYISPGWQPGKQETGRAVPTWNYVVVHAHGDLRIHEDPAWLRRHLEELTDRHEAGREEPWQVADAPADYTEKLMGAIVGLEIRITRLIGKWKMSQNRPAADQAGIVSGLLREEDAAAAAVARWMRELHGT